MHKGFAFGKDSRFRLYKNEGDDYTYKKRKQTNSSSMGSSTNWAYVTDGIYSSTNLTVDPAGTVTFFRLRYP